MLNCAKGVPWEPVPGGGTRELKPHFRILGPEEPIVRMPETQVWRIYITREAVSDRRYGLTIGCDGCKAANRGQPGGPHSKSCHERIEQAIEKRDPERYSRNLLRMLEREVSKSENEPASKRLRPAQEPPPATDADGQASPTDDNSTQPASSSTSPTDWSCPPCGHVNPHRYKFCPNCPSSLSTDGTALPTATDNQTTDTQTNMKRDIVKNK